MGRPDRRIDVLLGKATKWQDEMRFLRQLLLGTDLDEAFKWRQAAYTYQGENVLMLASRKGSIGLAFFRGALLSDPAQVLVSPGPNSQASRELRFTSLDEIRQNEQLIRNYVEEALQIHRDGRKVEFAAKTALELPEALKEALAEDESLSLAWDALTPGRQRSWVIHIDGAKQEATKVARVERARPKIIAGKGQLER